MRIYAYVRKDINTYDEGFNYVNYFLNFGYKIPISRIVIEEVAVETSIRFRDKFINLINYGLEEEDFLIVKSLDCLGSNFNEIKKILKKIEEKNLKFVCLEFSKIEITGDVKKILHHMIDLCANFENLYKDNKVRNHSIRKVGRPEILNSTQKEEIIAKFKQGYSVYSLAKEYSVTRTVIQRLLHKISVDV